MICIYPANCTDFSGNGLGIVQPQSCTVTETLNGEWELTLEHHIDEEGRWTRLAEGNILRAPVPAAMTPQIGLVSQQVQTATHDVLIYEVSTQRDPLRLRSGTGTDYRILGKYQKGTEVMVLNKTTSSWYEVTCPDGKHGYMSSEYLTYVRTETETTQTNVGFQNQVVEARQLRDQPFRIYRVVPELTHVTVYARHIFYDLLDNMIKSLKPSPSAVGASVVQGLNASCLTSHGFTFYSDLTSTADEVEWENINPVEAMLGEDGLVEKYGAELARDWFDVFLVKRVGVDSNVQIREKKNLLGIAYDVDETDVVTRIMPTGEDADGNILYLPELYIDSPNIGAYPHPKWIHISVKEAKEVLPDEDSSGEKETKTIAQCYEEMRSAVQAEYEKGCDLPTVTLKVDFVNCADTEEYRQYGFLQNIFLGDSVRVIAPRVGVSVAMRMTQYTYRKFRHSLLDGTPYLLVYTYGMSPEMAEGIRAFAKKKHLRVLSACFSFPWCDGNLDCSALDFCSVLDHADYVFTSTYHGTIFSILNHKRFVSFPQSRKTRDLLEHLSLVDRLINERDCNCVTLENIFANQIDYVEVDRILGDWREKSIHLLQGGNETRWTQYGC